MENTSWSCDIAMQDNADNETHLYEYAMTNTTWSGNAGKSKKCRKRG